MTLVDIHFTMRLLHVWAVREGRENKMVLAKTKVVWEKKFNYAGKDKGMANSVKRLAVVV